MTRLQIGRGNIRDCIRNELVRNEAPYRKVLRNPINIHSCLGCSLSNLEKLT